jgi:hypothetical protein
MFRDSKYVRTFEVGDCTYQKACFGTCMYLITDLVTDLGTCTYLITDLITDLGTCTYLITNHIWYVKSVLVRAHTL